MYCGDVGREALDLDLAVHEVEQAALLLDARRLAAQHDRHGDGDRLVHRHAVEVGVQQACVTGSSWNSFSITFGASPPSLRVMRVFAPDCEWRIFSRAFGSTEIDRASGLPPSSVAPP